MNFDREVRSLHIEASAGEPRVARTSFDRYAGRFDVSLEVPRSAAARHMRLHFTGTLVETVEVATLARPVGRGDVIKASDVVIERRPKATVAAGTLGSLGYVAGMSPAAHCNHSSRCAPAI